MCVCVCVCVCSPNCICHSTSNEYLLNYEICVHCSFMGRGVINFPVERVAQYMDDVQKMLNWERYLVVSALSISRLFEFAFNDRATVSCVLH